MRVFITQSKRRSLEMAQALHWWLPKVFEGLDPFTSTESIRSGDRWLSKIGEALEQAKIGIICVTPENRTEPWLLFEAGALGARFRDPNQVIPLLLGIEPSDLGFPLRQFQTANADLEGITSIVEAINSRRERPRSAEDLKDVMEAYWPRLAKRLKELPPPESPAAANAPQKDDRTRLREIQDDLGSIRQSLARVSNQVEQTHSALVASERPSSGRRDPLIDPRKIELLVSITTQKKAVELRLHQLLLAKGEDPGLRIIGVELEDTIRRFEELQQWIAGVTTPAEFSEAIDRLKRLVAESDSLFSRAINSVSEEDSS